MITRFFAVLQVSATSKKGVTVVTAESPFGKRLLRPSDFNNVILAMEKRRSALFLDIMELFFVCPSTFVLQD